MTAVRCFRLVGWLALLLSGGTVAVAQEENRAAVVVVDGDGQATIRCVGFAEPEISGFDALQRSGLALEVDIQSNGAAVCRVDGTGCPADDCFCACRGGGECTYWSYWQWRDDAWQYAPAGAAQSRVSHGNVEGWVWGLGSVTEAPEPPRISFAEVCGAGAVVAAPSTGQQGVAWQTYLPLAGVLLVLAGLALVIRRRAGGAA